MAKLCERYRRLPRAGLSQTQTDTLFDYIHNSMHSWMCFPFFLQVFLITWVLSALHESRASSTKLKQVRSGHIELKISDIHYEYHQGQVCNESSPSFSDVQNGTCQLVLTTCLVFLDQNRESIASQAELEKMCEDSFGRTAKTTRGDLHNQRAYIIKEGEDFSVFQRNGKNVHSFTSELWWDNKKVDPKVSRVMCLAFQIQRWTQVNFTNQTRTFIKLFFFAGSQYTVPLLSKVNAFWNAR